MASAEERAKIKLVFADSQENGPVVVYQTDTARVSAGAKAYPTGANLDALPFMGSSPYILNENAKLVFMAKGYAADTVESEESSSSIPVKLINMSTGAVYEETLNLGDDGGDFSGFSSTDDVVLNTTSFVRLGAYTVPAGHQLMLDPSRKVHIYLGDDTA